MNASLIHDATLWGTAIGTGAEIVCLLIGLILCAKRTRGNVRKYSVAGFALMLLYIPTVFASELLRPPSMNPNDHWLAASIGLLGTLFISAGLVCLGIAFFLGTRWTQSDGPPRRAWGEKKLAVDSGRDPHRTRSDSRRRKTLDDAAEEDQW